MNKKIAVLGTGANGSCIAGAALAAIARRLHSRALKPEPADPDTARKLPAK